MINSEYQQKTSLLFEFSMKTGDHFRTADPLSQIQLVVNLVPFLSTHYSHYLILIDIFL